MTEQAPNPEQQEQGLEYETDKLIELNELAQELYRVAGENYNLARTNYSSLDESMRHSPSDGVLDAIQELALAMTRRQGPAFGRSLVRKLYERADIRFEEAPGSGEGDQHIVLAEAVGQELSQIGESAADVSSERPNEK